MVVWANYLSVAIFYFYWPHLFLRFVQLTFDTCLYSAAHLTLWSHASCPYMAKDLQKSPFGAKNQKSSFLLELDPTHVLHISCKFQRSVSQDYWLTVWFIRYTAKPNGQNRTCSKRHVERKLTRNRKNEEQCYNSHLDNNCWMLLVHSWVGATGGVGACAGAGHVMSLFSSWQCCRICLYR